MSGLLGIIGGMGPYASAYFYKRLIEIQNVEREQDSIDILLYSKPSIPDRSAYILGNSKDSPLDAIISAGKALENAGASCIAIPCVTSHYFYEKIQANLKVPVINMAEETAVRAASVGCKRAGLLATAGTLTGRVLHRELNKLDIEAVTLPGKSQQLLMDLIYRTAKTSGAMDTGVLRTLSGELHRLGADTIIIGCTEISMAGREWHGDRYTDALEVLAYASLKKMGIACK